MIKKFNEFDKVNEEFHSEMSETMKEFRTALSQMDGHRDELDGLRRELWENDELDDDAQSTLEDALYDLETAITAVQEAQGWI